MWYDYRFRAYSDRTGVAAEAERYIDIHHQAYNHTRYEYNALDTDEDNIGSAYQHQKRLTEWKDECDVFSDVHSKALQKTIERFYDNLSTLNEKKAERAQGRMAHVEVTARVPERDVLAVRLRTQQHEWSDCHALAFENR